MLGDAVIVDLDKNMLHTEYNDVESLPNSTVSELKKKLKGLINDYTVRYTFVKVLIKCS